ncbi:MAG: cytidine deaminase, partial [Dehalococcoidia bacterium]|nr:cytidine deaminase [Dehalococcoidia bacterium]
FSALAIASEGGAAPCGACRQVIAEYAPNAEAILVDTNNPEIFEQTNISSLLPAAFTGKNLPPN